jgi:hypothetical protein
MIVSSEQKATRRPPLMNCTNVVETIPAVTTIKMTTAPTVMTPA